MLVVSVYLRYKLSQNTLRLFHVLPQFPFTASETELDYYYQKVNVRVDSRVAEQLKDYLRKLSAGTDLCPVFLPKLKVGKSYKI